MGKTPKRTGDSSSWISISEPHSTGGAGSWKTGKGDDPLPHRAFLLFLLTSGIALALLLSACERCDSPPGAITQKLGESLPWEQVALGLDPSVFHKRLSELSLVDPSVADKPSCRDQYVISVPDFHKNEIVERSAVDRRLTNCIIRDAGGSKAANLLEIRGEFLDNQLNRISFRFKPAEHATLRQTLENRFGKGENIVFRDRLMMTEEDIPCQIWSEGDESWLLTRAEQETALLVHQNWKEGLSLPPAPEASVRGKPVSLDDIGIGKLDLNAPVPELDLPDASPSKQLPTL